MKPEERAVAAGNTDEGPPSLASLFFTFLKIGATAFGGFMALISVVQHYAVERGKLLKHEDMLDGISLATILPGPVAVNVVAYVGYRVRGGLGALVCAVAVLLPSFVLIVALSYVYFRFGQIATVGRFFMGIVPAVAAIILGAAWNMAVKTVKIVPEAVITLAAFGLLLGIGGFSVTMGIIFGSGLLGWLLFRRIKPTPPPGAAPKAEKTPSERRNAGPAQTRLNSAASLPLAAMPLLGFNFAAAAKLFLVFGGMSVFLFGGAYVFIPLIQQVVVDGYGWVTRQEFIDGIALGQATPGPILISAAFIGYKVAGLLGAASATVGIYTPPALIMLLSTRFLDNIKKSSLIQAALRGIRPAVIGMIAAAAIVVARTAQPDWVSALIFVATLLALLRFKVESAWLIPAAGAAGLVLY